MADCTSHRHHTKRNGLTDNIKNTLLKTRRIQGQEKIINELIARMNSPPSREGPNSKKNNLRAGNVGEMGSSGWKMGGQTLRKLNLGISVGRTEEKGDRNPAKQLKRVLSVDKLSINMNGSGRSRKTKKQRAGLLGKIPLLLSKRSTEYSSQSQEEALKVQNQRIRDLCASQQERLLKLQKLIANEQKTQLLKRHMYEQNIERLKKIAALEIFPSEDSGNMEETGSYDQDCDCLSIHSR